MPVSVKYLSGGEEEMVKLIDSAVAEKILTHATHVNFTPTSRGVKRKGIDQEIGADQIKAFIFSKFDIQGKKKSILCPFHNDHHPSACVFPAGGFRCFASCFDAKYITAKKFYIELKKLSSKDVDDDLEEQLPSS